jgi:hypothetical protein
MSRVRGKGQEAVQPGLSCAADADPSPALSLADPNNSKGATLLSCDTSPTKARSRDKFRERTSGELAKISATRRTVQPR